MIPFLAPLLAASFVNPFGFSIVADVLPIWEYRLGWTLVHSVWQFTLVGIVLSIGNRLLQHRSANFRYASNVSVMFGLLVIPCSTWWLLDDSRWDASRAIEVISIATNGNAVADARPQPSLESPSTNTAFEMRPTPIPEIGLDRSPQQFDDQLSEQVAVDDATISPMVGEQRQAERTKARAWYVVIQQLINPWLGWIDGVWCVGVALLALRPIWGLWTQHHLRRMGNSSVSTEIQTRLKSIADRMGVTNAVRVAQSSLVKIPMVVGFLRPVILVPVSVLTGLSAEQLESLLAHEVAHIRRHDWLINAFQILVETLFFYHPTVWWLSKTIRHERELCCDDLALSIVQDKVAYGRMLLALEEMVHAAPTPRLAATGGNLVFRIRRLLPASPPRKSMTSSGAGGLILLAALGVFGGVAIFSSQNAPEPGSADRATQPVQVDETPIDASRPTSSDDLGHRHAVLTLSNHERELSQPLIDIATLTACETHFALRDIRHRPLLERWLRMARFGDLARTATGEWIAARGAKLLKLPATEPADVIQQPLAELKRQLSEQGATTLRDEDFHSACVLVMTAEGHVAVIQRIRPFPWSIKFDVYRLTTEWDLKTAPVQESWGPVVNGLQAGIVVESTDLAQGLRRRAGDSVTAKLFLRNTTARARQVGWATASTSPFGRPVTGLFSGARPNLKNPLGDLSPVAPAMNSLLHDSELKFVQVSAAPHEGPDNHRSANAVLLGTAAFVIWPAVDVDFSTILGDCSVVAAAPNQYRLSFDVETHLADQPRLRTGEIALEITGPEGADVSELHEWQAIRSGWRDPTGERSAMQADPAVKDEARKQDAEPLSISCLVVDRDSKQIIPHATVDFEVLVSNRREREHHSLCQYTVEANAAGLAEIQIPRPFLSRGVDGFKPSFRIDVTHPEYCRHFASMDLSQLQKAGLVGPEGEILRQSSTPSQKAASGLIDFQQVALKKARTVTGRLVGFQGEPLAGFQISVSNPSSGFPIWSSGLNLRTDPNGGFRLNLAENVAAKITFYDAEEGEAYSAREIVVADHQTRLGEISIVSEGQPRVKGQAVRGRVLDGRHAPVPKMSITTPNLNDLNKSGLTIYETDENGWFETEPLAPGRYRAEISKAVSLTEEQGDDESRSLFDRGASNESVYLPVEFSVAPDQPVDQILLRPVPTTSVQVRVVTTVPEPAENELPQVVDPLRIRQQMALIESHVAGSEQESSGEESERALVTIDPDSGELELLKSDRSAAVMSLTAIMQLATNPAYRIEGTINGQKWSDGRPFLTAMFSTETSVSTMAPRDLREIEFHAYPAIQHVQFNSGPKMFGSSFKIPRFTMDHLDVVLSHYRPTTLRIELQDVTGQPIQLTENQLPAGISVTAAYRRESVVREMGAVFESSEELMSREIWDHAILHYVLPDEEIDVIVTRQDAPVAYRLTLKDGETRTLRVKLGQGVEWLESSSPTAKIEAPKR